MKLFRKAILIVHGFAGGVYDQEKLGLELESISKFDVYQFTLPGHDGDYKNEISMKSWIESSEQMMKFLISKGYKQIYLIGHSMGGVIAGHLASKFPEVKKLVLVAPAYRYIGFPEGKFDLKNALIKPKLLFKQYGAQLLLDRITKLPANSFIEFMKLVKKYQNDVVNITCPLLIIWGLEDNVVPENAITFVYNKVQSDYKRIKKYEKTSHDVFRDEKCDDIIEDIIRFLK